MKYDTSIFIEKARKIHGDRYEYSQVVYDDSFIKVKIVCTVHGVFHQSPAKHLQGQGCPKCSYKERGLKSLEWFIAKSRAVHGEKYDYSETVYTGSSTKVAIICPIHGKFIQRGAAHMRGIGCPACAGVKKYTTEKFIEEAKKIHGNKYTYEKVEYIGNKHNVLITCKKHGYFVKQPLNHLQGYGCPFCSGSRLTFSKEVLIQQFEKLYDYTYEDFTYRNNKQVLTVTCPKHGKFKVSIVRHLYDHSGCPLCSKKISFPHQQLLTLLDGENVQCNTRKIIPPLELDIYLPDYKVAIEVNGLYYHSSRFIDRNYHYNKFKSCDEQGITLLQFFDFEILTKFDIVKDMILAKIGKLPTRIYARKCVIRDISSFEYREFLEHNHIQGKINSRIKLGLYYNKVLVMVAGFSKRPDFTIDRLASLQGTSVVGGAGKLIKEALRRSHMSSVVSFSANRYSTGRVYESLGFSLVSSTNYTMYYTDFKQLYSRNMFQKHKLLKRYNTTKSETAEDIAAEHGYYIIWGAGTRKWKLDVV